MITRRRGWGREEEEVSNLYVEITWRVINTVEVAGVMSSSAFHGSIGAKNSSNLLTLKLESN